LIHYSNIFYRQTNLSDLLSAFTVTNVHHLPQVVCSKAEKQRRVQMAQTAVQIAAETAAATRAILGKDIIVEKPTGSAWLALFGSTDCTNIQVHE